MEDKDRGREEMLLLSYSSTVCLLVALSSMLHMTTFAPAITRLHYGVYPPVINVSEVSLFFTKLHLKCKVSDCVRTKHAHSGSSTGSFSLFSVWYIVTFEVHRLLCHDPLMTRKLTVDADPQDH